MPLVEHPYFNTANYPTLKTCDSKKVCAAMPIIMPFKVLKYFSSGKISFFLFASLWQQYHN